MVKVEMASAIAFNKISFSPWGKSRRFHVCNYCQSLTFISKKAFFLHLPIIKEDPSISHIIVSL